jgi:hypothetical protein
MVPRELGAFHSLSISREHKLVVQVVTLDRLDPRIGCLRMHIELEMEGNSSPILVDMGSVGEEMAGYGNST